MIINFCLSCCWYSSLKCNIWICTFKQFFKKLCNPQSLNLVTAAGIIRYLEQYCAFFLCIQISLYPFALFENKSINFIRMHQSSRIDKGLSCRLYLKVCSNYVKWIIMCATSYKKFFEYFLIKHFNTIHLNLCHTAFYFQLHWFVQMYSKTYFRE